MPKNSSKAKSARKPLMDISNGPKSSKPITKKISENEKVDEENSLDRLLLVHSDLSNLVHLIDKLVVQAFKLKPTDKKGRKEIESFTKALSDMHSSLKSWVPRFQKALSSLSEEPTKQLGLSLSNKAVTATNEETSNATDTPEQCELGSLVSPSPLVSWRGDCTVERGRQLFLLTPLPRSKALSPKHQGLSRSVFERITDIDAPPHTASDIPSLLTISGNTNDDLLEGIEIKVTPHKVANSAAIQSESILERGPISPPRFSNRDHSMFLMTPRLKLSPPKSCMLLEPICESSHQDNDGILKSAPFAVGTQNCSGSEPSSSQVSESLALKYPELFGLQLPRKRGNGRKEIEASLEFLMSPPKTCVLMEPPEEKLSINLVATEDLPSIELDGQAKSLAAVMDNDVKTRCQSTKQSCNQELLSTSLAFVENTPMWKEPESTIRISKHPGENTLKRELWTKFEAASKTVLHFDVSAFQETAQKGFIDRLEEVSGDSVGEEISSVL